MMMDPTLKPCPFCGGTEILHSAIRDGREVFCRGCRASARAYSPDALRKAIEAWNRRALNSDDTFVDEHGTTWHRPTAWAYYANCKARDKYRAERDAALGMSTNVLDIAWNEINSLGGVPCCSHDHVYNAAIRDALRVIERLGGRDPLMQRHRQAEGLRAENVLADDELSKHGDAA